MPGKVIISGLPELKRNLRRIDSGLPKYVGRGLRQSAKLVQDDARSRQASLFDRTRPGALVASAKGLTGIVQSRGSRHKRGDFGALIMTRVLLPARAAKQEAAVRELEDALTQLFRTAGF